MKISLLLLILLSGCSSNISQFQTFDHSDEPWGTNVKRILYDKSNITVIGKLSNIKTTIQNGYRIDTESWMISVINTSNESKCININIHSSTFNIKNLKYNTINTLPNSLLNIAILTQKTKFYTKILGFDYVGISNAIVSIKKCE
jgi:hypothetical protein